MITVLHDIARAWDVSWWGFLHVTGSDNPAGVEYGALSGWVGDLGLLAVLGGMVHMAHEHNCQVKGCWRIGSHPTDAGHKACKKHHPTRGDSMTAQELLDRHDEVKKPGTI
jgi:hypothetical protein